MKPARSIHNITINENTPGQRALFSIQVKYKYYEVDSPKDISCIDFVYNVKEKLFNNKEIEAPITINEVKISPQVPGSGQGGSRTNADEADLTVKYRDELQLDEHLIIYPNYTEKFSFDGSEGNSVQKMQLKCNYMKENPNQKTKKIKLIIINDKDIENSRNYIKENYKFKKYEYYKNLVDKLVLSRKDIDRNKYQQLNHDLENFNLYAEIVDTINCQLFTENEIDNISNQFENINIESEISQFIDLCFNLITEYLKFILVKEVKFNKCQNCGAKCLYILFPREQKRIAEECRPTNEELEKGINIIENLLDQEDLSNLNAILTNNKLLVTNVIYLNAEVNKNDIELIEKTASGTVLYIKNINELEILLNEITQKNEAYNLFYKFLLICTGEFSNNVIEILNKKQNRKYKYIIDKVVIYCQDRQQYLNLRFIDDVIDNKELLEEYIKKKRENSKLYRTFPIINYESYTKIHNKIHKQLAKYYGKVPYSYKNAINLFKEFLFNEYNKNLKLQTGKKTKNEVLLEALEVFSTNPKKQDKKKIRRYGKDKNSYYQDSFNLWLDNFGKTAINKIAYFISSLMFALNSKNAGITSEEILYKATNTDFSNIINIYLNYLSDDNIISFLSFTSTSTNEETSKSLITSDGFGLLFKINYNYKENWKSLSINTSSISADIKDERLFLPFTFYKIKNFELNIENKLAKIELDCIFKKEILEENLNENNNIIYNKEDNIMELDNIVIVNEEEEEEKEGFLINDNENKSNELTLRIKIEEIDLNKPIYFLDNTDKHDNLCEMNESNTTLVIEGNTVPFKKSFISTNIGTYNIKLLFKCKLSNCAYMFCQCNNIIDIDFSKFNTEKITDMQRMFYYCSSLTSLDLKSFKTDNVTTMYEMFEGCESLTTLDLSSFNTEKVTNMCCMFYYCSGLESLDLKSFNTKDVTIMEGMFFECSSLKSLNITSFNTQKVTNMQYMFQNCCSLSTLNLSSFNASNADTSLMFDYCQNLQSCGSSDANIVKAFKNKAQ